MVIVMVFTVTMGSCSLSCLSRPYWIRGHTSHSQVMVVIHCHGEFVVIMLVTVMMGSWNRRDSKILLATFS